MPNGPDGGPSPEELAERERKARERAEKRAARRAEQVEAGLATEPGRGAGTRATARQARELRARVTIPEFGFGARGPGAGAGVPAAVTAQPGLLEGQVQPKSPGAGAGLAARVKTGATFAGTSFRQGVIGPGAVEEDTLPTAPSFLNPPAARRVV